MQETMISVPFGSVTIAVEHYKALIERVAQLENEVETYADRIIDIAKCIKAEEAYYNLHKYNSGNLMAQISILVGLDVEDGHQE